MNKTSKIIIGIVILVIIVGLAFVFGGEKKKEKQIKVGAILPFTGVASYPGEQAELGISIATKEINSSGGINGKILKVIYEDSKTKPSEGVSAFKKLVSVDGVDIIITALSAVSMAVAPIAGEEEVPIVGIMTTAEGFTQNEWTFRYQPLTDIEIKPIVEIIRSLDLQKVGVLYLNDELGSSVYSSIKEEVENLNKEVVGEKYNITESNFKDAITKLRANNVDSIYIVGFDSHLINIAKTLINLDFDGTILSASTLSLPNAREKIKDIDKEIYIASPPMYLGSELTEEAKKFKEVLNQNYDTELNHYNAISYDVVKVIEKALREGKTNSRLEIKDSLENLEEYSGVFGDLMITENAHEISYSFYPAIIEGGELYKFK